MRSRRRDRGLGRSRARRPGRARRGPCRRSSASTAAVRSGVSGESAAERTGTESSAAAASTRCRDRRRRRLGDQQHPLGGRVGVQRGQRVEGGQPADGLGQVAPADTEHVARRRRRPCRAGRRPAGRRCRDAATRPTGPRPDDVGEAEGDAGDDRRPAVGAHDQHAGVVRGALERHLVLDRDAVGEDQHAAAGGDRVGGLGDGVGPGHGDDRQRRPSGGSSARPAPMVRCGDGLGACRRSAPGRPARRRRRRPRRPARRRPRRGRR